MRSIALACGVMAAACSAQSSAAEITHETIDDQNVIIISGAISLGDEVVFRKLALAHDDAVVVLASEGGNLVPAIEIGKAIHLRGYSTLVPDDAVCTSSCALIWVAGSTRFLAPSGKVGFHASYMNVDGRAQETGMGNAIVGRYLTLLNLPERAVLFATVASPSEITWIDPTAPSESGIAFTLLDGTSTRSGPEATLPTARAESPAATASGTFWSGPPGWEVTSHENRCILGQHFTTEGSIRNKSSVVIAFQGSREPAVLIVANEKYRSLVVDREYQISIGFVRGEKVDTGWGTKTAVGVSVDGVGNGYGFSLDAEDLLKDIAAHESVGFAMGDDLIDAYPLAGSSAGVAALKRCDAARRKSRLDDPFRGQ